MFARVNFILAILVIPVMLLSAKPALSKEGTTRSLAVLKLGQDTKETAGIVAAIERAVRKYHKSYALADLHGILNAEGENDMLDKLTQGLSFIKGGIAAWKAGKTDVATNQLTGAVANLTEAFVYLKSSKPFRKLLLDLGALYLASGKKKLAKQTFEKAALMRARASYTTLNDAASAAFSAAKKRINARSRGGLSVITSPEAVEVYVDGVFRGVTPLAIEADEGFRAGTHIIGLKKLGYVRETRVVNIKANQKSTVLAEMSYARQYILMNQILAKEALPSAFVKASKSSPQAGKSITRIGRILQSEVALVVKMEGPADAVRVEAKLFDTGSGRFLNSAKRTIDFSFVNRNPVNTLIREVFNFDYATALGAAKPTQLPPPVVKPTKLTDRWWFWTVVGVAVIGATAGTVYGVLSQKPEPAYTKDGSGALVLRF